jgi:SAM-dependent methyltransferase
MTDQQKNEQIRNSVRQRYGEVARRQTASCCSTPASSAASCCGSIPNASASCCADAPANANTSCCGSAPASASACCGAPDGESLAAQLEKAVRLGYTLDDLLAAPPGANMSLGCGNPGAIAALRPGEVVLDLGCGGGFDCFLAAQRVGEKGRVIGVDMTPDMLLQARANAQQSELKNVEFRLGEIEHMPVADGSVDVIISNCVINLSPDKEAVFQEAYRVLKPGGRLAIADTVATVPLSEAARQDMALWAGCISGSAFVGDLERMLQQAGFAEISIRPKDESREMIREWAPGHGVEEYVLSATIEAAKPKP